MDSTVEGRLSGTSDMFPEDHKYLTFLKKVFRHEFRKNGFRRISTPLLEDSALIRKIYPKNSNSYGIYEFQDKADQSVAMAPSGALGTMRAYLEHEKHEELQPVYYYYMERFFRQDRQRKEYYTIGGEVIGESDPIIDAQNLYMIYTALQKMWVSDTLKIHINSYGNTKEMTKFFEDLESFLANKWQVMSEWVQEIIANQPLALFLSEDEDDQILAQSAPQVTKFLKKDSKKYFELFKTYLEDLAIEFEENSSLFFPEGFYTGIIWKIQDDAGNTFASGGRYDDLATAMWSPKYYPASGFWVDVERIIALLKEKNISIKNKDQIDLYFVQLGDDAKRVVFPLSLQARQRGINTQASLGTPSMKEQMLKAQRIGATYVVLVWVMEARSGVFQVRNMEDGTQAEVKKEDLIDYIIEKIGEDQLDFYEPSRDLLRGEE